MGKVEQKKHSDKRKDQIDEQYLLDYLRGSLSPGEQHELELMSEQNSLLEDALDGLSTFDKPEHLQDISQQLNQQLRNHIRASRGHRRRRKKNLQLPAWIYVLAVILLLLLSCWVLYIAL